MQSLAIGSVISRENNPEYFLGGTSAATMHNYKSQTEEINISRSQRTFTIHLVGSNNRVYWLNSESNHMESELEVIKLSISSPTIERPEWVQCSKDMVRWIRLRKLGLNNVDES